MSKLVDNACLSHKKLNFHFWNSLVSGIAPQTCTQTYTKSTPKLKYRVLKVNTCLSSFAEAPIKSPLAVAFLVLDRLLLFNSLLTGYLRPCELDNIKILPYLSVCRSHPRSTPSFCLSNWYKICSK